jgi:hypothetical protein
MASSVISPSSNGAVAARHATVLSRLRAWIAMLVVRRRKHATDGGGHFFVGDPHFGSLRRTKRVADSEPAAILQFPRSGNWHLAQLARDLRQRFAAIGLVDFAPFLLAMERGDHPRLWIDQTAYAECCGPDLGYRVVLNDAFEARITIETHDFRAIEALVGHYIVARLSDPDVGGEAA